MLKAAVLLLVLLTPAPALLAPSFRAATHAFHHLLNPPAVLRTSADLEALSNTRIPRSDGGEILAAVARPSQLTGKPLRVLVVLHEFFGLTESIVGKAQAYADELECLVIAPDTFRGTTTSFIPQAIWLALSTPQQRVNKDLTDVFAWASEQPGVNAARPAVLGFCYGGGKALRFTTQIKPDAATVVFYGNPLTSPEDFAKLRAPVCGIFGTRDPQIPQGLVAKFREALEAANVEHEVMSYYGVGHAFWTDVGQVEREEMPQLAAWRLSTNFLRNHFEGKESFARKRAFLEFMLEEQAAREASDPQAEAPLDPTE
jgi:carboxymethylenebutenolidase